VVVLISVQPIITGDGYIGVPSFRITFKLGNNSKAVIQMRRIFYELFVGNPEQFIGGGEAFKRGEGDNDIDLIYMCAECKDIRVASIFELTEQKIGIIENSIEDENIYFKLNVYGDAGIRYIEDEDNHEFTYKRLKATESVSISRSEWDDWMKAWGRDKRVVLVKEETFIKMQAVAEKLGTHDYDELLQKILSVELSRASS